MQTYKCTIKQTGDTYSKNAFVSGVFLREGIFIGVNNKGTRDTILLLYWFSELQEDSKYVMQYLVDIPQLYSN